MGLRMNGAPRWSDGAPEWVVDGSRLLDAGDVANGAAGGAGGEGCVGLEGLRDLAVAGYLIVTPRKIYLPFDLFI